MDKLNIWFAINELPLNVSKTNLCCLAIAKKKYIEKSITNAKIDMVYKIKFLGVLVDNKLNWKDHIDMIKTKLLEYWHYVQSQIFIKPNLRHDIALFAVRSICNLLLVSVG